MSRQETDITGRRRFLLIDAIMLVAAAALMLSSDRAIHWFWGWGDPVASYTQWETRLMAWSLALAGLSLVLLCPLLARPAGRRGLLRGAPGLFVHLAVATVLVVQLTGWLSQEVIARGFQGKPGFYSIRWTVEIMNYLRDDLRRDVAVGVAASWLALAVVGRWNPERAWDDRLGRSVGALWMIFYLGAPLLALWP
jgi:hypothetical protein